MGVWRTVVTSAKFDEPPFDAGRHFPTCFSATPVGRGSWGYRDPLPEWPRPTSCEPARSSRATRVLIVDDNSRTRAGLRALLLTTPGLKVVGEAADGTVAVRMAATLQPDVVLMDVRLPDLDGIEATRIIKGRQPGVRVVVLTISAAYRTESLAAGADAFLVKGGPADELMSAILGADDPGPRSGRRARRAPSRRQAPGHRPFGPCFGMPLT